MQINEWKLWMWIDFPKIIRYGAKQDARYTEAIYKICDHQFQLLLKHSNTIDQFARNFLGGLGAQSLSRSPRYPYPAERETIPLDKGNVGSGRDYDKEAKTRECVRWKPDTQQATVAHSRVKQGLLIFCYFIVRQTLTLQETKT